MDVPILTTVLNLISQAVRVAGGLIVAWGLINLGTNFKEHNGPAITTALWMIIGGALVYVAGHVILSVV